MYRNAHKHNLVQSDVSVFVWGLAAAVTVFREMTVSLFSFLILLCCIFSDCNPLPLLPCLPPLLFLSSAAVVVCGLQGGCVPAQPLPV